LRALGDVIVIEERFVCDDNVWSLAGVSAGTDLILAFIAYLAGEETAGKVQFAAEYYPSTKRYGPMHHGPMAPGYLMNTV
jgi:transcriptional regulator GlxA family with amidase domain